MRNYESIIPYYRNAYKTNVFFDFEIMRNYESIINSRILKKNYRILLYNYRNLQIFLEYAEIIVFCKLRRFCCVE